MNSQPSKPFSINKAAMKIFRGHPEQTSARPYIFNGETTAQVKDLRNWLSDNDASQNKAVQKGYTALINCPAGTGKTIIAQMISEEKLPDVHQINLSTIISSYAGETQKNIDLLFANAEKKGWILFFDEADALFSKRSEVRDAHDRYANIEINYLLQRIETFRGLIILATDKTGAATIDCLRRFDTVMNIPFPGH